MCAHHNWGKMSSLHLQGTILIIKQVPQQPKPHSMRQGSQYSSTLMMQNKNLQLNLSLNVMIWVMIPPLYLMLSILKSNAHLPDFLPILSRHRIKHMASGQESARNLVSVHWTLDICLVYLFHTHMCHLLHRGKCLVLFQINGLVKSYCLSMSHALELHYR